MAHECKNDINDTHTHSNPAPAQHHDPTSTSNERSTFIGIYLLFLARHPSESMPRPLPLSDAKEFEIARERLRTFADVCGQLQQLSLPVEVALDI